MGYAHTGFPGSGTLLTIAHTGLQLLSSTPPLLPGHGVTVTRSFHIVRYGVVTEDMFPQGTGSGGAHCPAPLRRRSAPEQHSSEAGITVKERPLGRD